MPFKMTNILLKKIVIFDKYYMEVINEIHKQTFVIVNRYICVCI